MPAPMPASGLAAQAGHPSGDRRFAVLENAMRRHQYRHDALIEVLHTAQQQFGCLEPDLLYFIAQHMKLPPSRVYGVATFYHFFTLKPQGRHACVVCTGTACFVRGAAKLLEAVSREAGIEPGESTPDGELSLLTARCVGSCGIAPTVVLDGTVVGHPTPESLLRQIEGWWTRGPDGPG